MNNLPVVSVIIPYQSDRGWLNEAIDSVHHQTYKGKIELIESSGQYSVSKNINRGFQEVTGKYVKFFAEDDLLTSICIEESVKVLEETSADFIHGNAFNFFEKDIPRTNRPQYPDSTHPTLTQMIERNRIHGLTLMYRTETINKMIDTRGFWFDESIDCAEESDVNMWLLAHGYKLEYVHAFLGFYRRHEKQKSLGKDIDQIERAAKIKAIRNRYV
jgi:glycosyltransferase involved in cell wall biosynthesis